MQVRYKRRFLKQLAKLLQHIRIEIETCAFEYPPNTKDLLHKQEDVFEGKKFTASVGWDEAKRNPSMDKQRIWKREWKR